MVEGLANYFGTMDNQVVMFNSIAEIMANSLEDRQINNFIDYMQVRLDSTGQTEEAWPNQ